MSLGISLRNSMLSRDLGMAVSWLFVEPSFQEDKGKKVFEMLDDIKEAFASLVSRIDWMDGQTKTATLEKNRKMESQIGFPDWLFDEDILNEYYEGVRDTLSIGSLIIAYLNVPLTNRMNLRAFR